MENSGELNQLNSLYEIKGLVMKLPYNMRIKFRSKIALYQDQSMINFRLFSDFVREQAKVMKFPLFESLRDPCDAEKTLVTTSMNQNTMTADAVNLDHSSPPCMCCGKMNHQLDNSLFF